jgi:hypothetical protein
LIVEEDGLLGIAPGGEVVKGAGEFDAQGAGDGNDRSGSNPKIKDLTPFYAGAPETGQNTSRSPG